MTYLAPVKDMLFAMEHLAGIEQVAGLPAFGEAGLETAQAVLQECARFCEGVVAPLNVPGDQHPSTFKDGAVTTPPGFRQAFEQYAQGGWQGLQHPPAYGGQGLPILLNQIPAWLGVPISTATASHLEYMIFGALIVFFLIVEPHGLARLWAIGKEKLRLWPFPH